jgi:murein L,D-transpeptidase YafK
MNMQNKKTLFILLSLISLLGETAFAQSGFLSQQRGYTRVRAALTEKESLIRTNLNRHGLNPDSIHILIVALKAEKQLEIYAKKKTESTYKRIAVYDICSSSGTLGPKRQEGDGQVPEGFYHIDRFNPSSSFHLSLGIDYPNQADRKKSQAARLGGDIFIHGSCVTIGCLPMTDDKIKEIYLYAVYARNNGQKQIPVYIFPFKMTDSNSDLYKQKFGENKELLAFWSNLKQGFAAFENKKKALQVSVDKDGNYVFSQSN